MRCVSIFLPVWLAVSLLLSETSSAMPLKRFRFNLPKLDLTEAIFKLADTTSVQIFFLPKTKEDRVYTRRLTGRYTVLEALDILLKDTGLTYVANDENTIIIKEITSLPVVPGEPDAIEEMYREADTASGPADKFEEIITIGTRQVGRTVTESMVPIDVFTLKSLSTTGYLDMNDALRTLVPAFHVKRLTLNDGSSIVRPATLRSSPADHVLLMMNGKRRHRSSTVHIATGHATTSGSQGQDFNVIPAVALKTVEVLRDGAAAMYGSDAIAGVINYTLKDAPSGGSISSHIGSYYQNGGRIVAVEGNIGLPLSTDGFINLSAEYVNQNRTNAGGIHTGAEAIRNSGISPVPMPANVVGEPHYEGLKTAWNMGVPISSGVNAYLFGNYMHSESEISFFYRQPIDAGGYSRHAVFAESIYEGSAAHPADFDLTAVYPGGFRPDFRGQQQDFSSVIGIRSTENSITSWDVSFRWGENKVSYYLNNTINASLGVFSPTDFQPGALKQREFQANAEMSHGAVVKGLHSELIVSAGLSYRDEAYTIAAGDPASYAIGPLRDLPAGSNGFQGYSPEIAGVSSAGSYAAYLDMEADITDRWSMAVGGRAEDYEAFGSNFSYKVATRYQINDSIALRGSLSTGFRAPATGQLFGASQTSQINVNGEFKLDAVLAPDSAAAAIFGAAPIRPETAFNLSAGMIASFENGPVFTLDFYQILVDDRLILIPEFETTPQERLALSSLGYPNGEDVHQVRFFQNELNTKVKGVDLVASYRSSWSAIAHTNFNLAINYNRQSLREPTAAGILTPAKRVEFEAGIPRWNGNLSISHQQGAFSFMVRGTYYGAWKRRSIDDARVFLDRKPAMLFDLVLTHKWSAGWEGQVGARNILNKQPPKRDAYLEGLGLLADNHSVYGVSGGYYYAGLRYNF